MFMVDLEKVLYVSRFVGGTILSRVCCSVEDVSGLMVVVDDLGGGTDGGLVGGLEMVAGIVFLLCDEGLCDVGVSDGVGVCEGM